MKAIIELLAGLVFFLLIFGGVHTFYRSLKRRTAKVSVVIVIGFALYFRFTGRGFISIEGGKCFTDVDIFMAGCLAGFLAGMVVRDIEEENRELARLEADELRAEYEAYLSLGSRKESKEKGRNP